MDLLDDDGLLNLRTGKRTDPKALMDELAARRTKTPAVNDALAKWAEEAKVDPDAPAPSGPRPCHICQQPAKMTCAGCERPTCAGDSWVMLGLCKGCADAEAVRRMHQEG